MAVLGRNRIKEHKGEHCMAHVLIQSPEQLAPYMGSLLAAKVMAGDTETTGLDPHTDRLRLVQIAINNG